ncbi:MAG: hypothetical protein QOK39_437, partial [Acidimicrobiaceae bacterium]|nr:hypothetical protein [Acidimicrobiaceae bacterium]
GGFDMEAAEAVCPGVDVEDFEVVELLDALVDKSLVQADDSGATARFRLLETMHEYAGAKLAGRDDSERAQVARSHRDYYLALAGMAEPHLHGPGEVEWAARLDLELCNLRGALATSLSDPDPDPGLRLGASLGEFWFLRGYGVEGADTLRAHLDRASGEAPRLLRGRALAAAGRLVEEYVADYPLALMMAEEALAIAHDEGDDVLAMRAILVVVIARNLQGDHRGSLELIDEALPAARRLDDPRHAARLLNARGWALDELGLDGRASYEECAELNRRAGDQRGLAAGVGNLGFLALLAGDLDAAREHNGEALRVFRELGDLRGVAIGSLNSGYATYLDGDGVAACRLFLECLATARRMGARRYVAYAILGLADTATLTGHSQRAATLHGAFDALFEQLGAGIEALEARLREADHARLRALLGDSAFDIAYSAGRALPLDHVLALAISPAD